MNTRMLRPLRVLLLVAGVLAAGCATGPNAAKDPLEPINRVVFSFNETLDDALVAPAARAYKATVPELFRQMLGNVVDNFADLWTAVNNALQGKPGHAASDLGRFVINTTFGFAGLADVATEMGLERNREDFGQTLGRWGVPSGPYLVLPFLGPSSFRDAPGLVVDSAGDPLLAFAHETGRRNTTWAVRALDRRAGLLGASDVLEGAALDKYGFLRDAYLKRRRYLVFDGDPPDEQ